MPQEWTRREAMKLGAASLAALSLPGRANADAPDIEESLVREHDAKVKRLLERQIVDASSPWRGSLPDEYDIHYCTAPASMLKDIAAAYYHPASLYSGDAEIVERMRLALGFLTRAQNDLGLVDLYSTNFESAPDTGFVVHGVASAAKLAQLHADDAVLDLYGDFLQRAGAGLCVGGIHTPNHRWVVSAALAQIHDLFPDPAYLARIEQWLGEGIDIDAEGQYTERSSGGYNVVVNNALVTTAHKLDRPELLDAVRKNLDAMVYLLHPNGEVVTEISSRQDLNTRATMAGYWFVLRYLAVRDQNGLYASMLAPLEPANRALPALMEYPELLGALPAPAPIPDDYERALPLAGITRIRRGARSTTILHTGNSRWITMRNGGAVVNDVRFASAFFGKGQFVPRYFERTDDGFVFTQQLQGRYLQPITDPDLLPVTPENWSRLVLKREQTQICTMDYEARIRETPEGFEFDISAAGTDKVPLAVEINLREGGELAGVIPAPRVGDAFLLPSGMAEYTLGSDRIGFGPGKTEHAWVQLRGAEGKLSGPSVYITGYTPFRHTLRFELG
ncbi:MAG: hypothetical protein GC168_09945 [Candidatus Hydrogenedens sp.]|nr:hypothetical protein [Candidatus Hydrogenedens sp.]